MAVRELLRDESAQDLAEYAVLIGLIALAVFAAVALVGDAIANTFSDIGSSMAD